MQAYFFDMTQTWRTKYLQIHNPYKFVDNQLWLASSALQCTSEPPFPPSEYYSYAMARLTSYGYGHLLIKCDPTHVSYIQNNN